MSEDLARAQRLYRQQRKERGTVWHEFQVKKQRVVGPYKATPEREGRAAEIIRLRRRAWRKP